MFNEPAQDSSKRPIAKVFRENRCDPLDEETLQLQSEPAKSASASTSTTAGRTTKTRKRSRPQADSREAPDGGALRPARGCEDAATGVAETATGACKGWKETGVPAHVT